MVICVAGATILVVLPGYPSELFIDLDARRADHSGENGAMEAGDYLADSRVGGG